MLPRTLVEGRCARRSSYSCAAPPLRCFGPFPESSELRLNERDELCFAMKLVEGQTMEAMLKGYENEVRRFDWVRRFSRS